MRRNQPGCYCGRCEVSLVDALNMLNSRIKIRSPQKEAKSLSETSARSSKVSSGRFGKNGAR